MKWEKVKLGDIATCIQPGPFGSQLHNSDYSKEGTPIIMPKDIVGGAIVHSGLLKVSEEHVKRLSRHQVYEGNLMVARKGDVRKCAYITENENGWMTGSDCLKVVLDESKCYSKFIYYQLRSDYIGRWLEKVSTGATMPSLNTGLLSGIEMVLPPIEIQKQIADILSAYDDLIENNQKQIKLLEEAAQRLYKEWFVDLRFPGHENTKIVDGVPEGWIKEEIGKIIKKVHRTKQIVASEYKDEGSIPIVDQSRAFVAGYTNDLEARVDFGIPIIVFGDHTRIVKLIQFPFAKGADGTQLIISDCLEMPQRLLYCSIMNVDLSNYHYARHFKYLKEEKIMIPTVKVANKFENNVTEVFSKIQNCRDEITRCQKIRNLLLPKLMSGEVEV